jgi:hypothetical protein
MKCGLACAVVAFGTVAVASTTDAAIMTTTGPTYQYSWNVATNMAPDTNATYTGDGPVDNGTTYRDNGNWSGNAVFTVLYEFQTPTGYTFSDASVFTRASLWQNPEPADFVLGEYSVDGGATYTQFYLLNTRTTKAETAPLAVSGKDNVRVRYTLDRDRNQGDLTLFDSTTNSAGFSFSANIVPEPSALALIGLAVVPMLRRRHNA